MAFGHAGALAVRIALVSLTHIATFGLSCEIYILHYQQTPPWWCSPALCKRRSAMSAGQCSMKVVLVFGHYQHGRCEQHGRCVMHEVPSCTSCIYQHGGFVGHYKHGGCFSVRTLPCNQFQDITSTHYCCEHLHECTSSTRIAATNYTSVDPALIIHLLISCPHYILTL